MGSSESPSFRRLFNDNGKAIALWLQHESFEIKRVRSSTSEWGRIQFTVEFSESEEDSAKHSEWSREYLEGHKHVVRTNERWSVSPFVLLEELGLEPPNDWCRLAGCSQESDYWVVDPDNGRSRQYCNQHATLAGRSLTESTSKETTNP